MSDHFPRPSLASLLENQRGRWKAGDTVRVEDYLAAHPGLADDANALLELIFQEVLLREERGEVPQLEEYVDRFPSVLEKIRQRFSLDQKPAEQTAASGDVPLNPSPTEKEAGAHPAPPGEFPRLEGYEILSQLGRGGMGVVYKAWHVPLKRLVAVKMLRSPEDAEPHELTRFRQEAEAIARLHHPHIVQIHEVGEQHGRPYLTLEYVEGGSLADRLDGTPWPARPAAELIQTLAQAIQHAHERGIIHRDLKPANVLLQKKDEGGRMKDEKMPSADSSFILPPSSFLPKITDFGLARVFIGGADSLTQSGQIMGTPSYVAPEQAGGRSRHVGPATDVYALGAILYELLTGRPPFKGETMLDTLQQVLYVEPVPPTQLQPKTPRDLETICLKCLRKDAGRRYASAADLVEDLRRFLGGEPILARPVGSMERAWRWCRRRPAVASLLALLIVVVLGAIAGLTALWQRAEGLRQDAETKKAEAEAANAEALDYFGVARDAIKGYVERVKENPQLREADLRPLRKELLATVVPFYERLTRRESKRDALQVEQAQAYDQLAEVTREIDDPAKAEEQLQAALRIFERLAAEQPEEPRHQFQRAKQHHNLGMLYSGDLARRNQSEEEYRKAIALKEDLATRHPDVGEYQQALALSVNNLGTLHWESRRRDLARTEFLRALQIQEELVKQHPTVANYKEELALSRNNFGHALLEEGQGEAGEKELNEAVRLQEEVVQQRPRDLQSQNYLARFRMGRARYVASGRQLDKAEAEYNQIIQTLEQVTRNYPSYLPCQEDLAECYEVRGWFYVGRGKAPEAETDLLKAVEIRKFLAHLQPRRLPAQNALANAHSVLATLYGRCNQPAKAQAEYQKALAILEPIPRDHPDARESLLLLGETFYNVAFQFRSSGQAETALEHYAKAQKVLDDLLSRQPKHETTRLRLLTVHWDRAAAFMELARYEEALKDWDRALALDNGQHRSRFRASRAVVLARLKRHAEAVAEAEDLAGAKQSEALNVFHAACACAVSSTAVRGDTSLDPAEREKLAERYAGRALAMLQRLHEAGYFKAPRRIKDLKTEKDLDPLRTRSEFKTLLAAVENPAKAPGP
jgi:tetratricopeptide (TPR) repeat protein